jgi:hypothetical protein
LPFLSHDCGIVSLHVVDVVVVSILVLLRVVLEHFAYFLRDVLVVLVAAIDEVVHLRVVLLVFVVVLVSFGIVDVSTPTLS